MESVVTIPFDFEELPTDHRKSIVPICIARLDANGEEIAWGWFDAVVPIQDSLRALARRRLNDVWRVSELTELSVHNLWRRHRHNLGFAPSRRIYKRASWDVEDLRKSGWRNRRGRELALDAMEEVAREYMQRDPTDYEGEYQFWLRVDEVDARLKARGREDVRAMLDLMIRGHKWSEISDQFDEPEPNLRRRFARWMKELRRAV